MIANRAARPVCIIPARGRSQRLPRKNLALVAGKPLLVYAIDAAVQSEVFSKVCVSSEDDEIIRLAESFPAVTVSKRPLALADEQAQVKDVCRDLLDRLAEQGELFEAFGLLLVTNPLRTALDVVRAHKIFEEKQPDGVISLVPFSHPPQRAVAVRERWVEPYFGVENMKQAQQLEQLYRHDGSVIFARTAAFRTAGGFYLEKLLPYFVPPERSVDIDNPLDLLWAEFLMERRL